MVYDNEKISSMAQQTLSVNSPSVSMFTIENVCHTIFPKTLPRNDRLSLFLAHTLKLKQEIPYLETVLPASELDRANRFKYEKNRNLFITAHGLLRMILENLLGVPAIEIKLKTGTHGKPAIKESDYKPISFNISHSEAMVAILLSSHYQVGVDVERIRPIKDLNSIVQNYFHPKEISSFEKSSDQEKSNTFYKIWTKKEAVTKAFGKGLLLPLDSFFVGDSDTKWDQICMPEKPYPPCFSFSFSPLPEYIGALSIIKS